ncbi:hypothetical protein AcW1_006534 [Taiwanofungus camphoratus]|nr:hypothetical protein AcV5_009123 [Antrodia cinnamomea]KAI0954741.1 hypothetical protein AcW1_006534 [Antrodia cinnamomea]
MSILVRHPSLVFHFILMPTCIICLDSLKDPAALPCGHVFCHQCIVRIVRTITPYTHHHFCPTCRHPYTLSQVDPALVPHHLQHHVTPSVRKLHLEYNIPSPTKLSSPGSECDQLRAENSSLRSCCIVWRKRAEVHAAATLGLVGLARLARDAAIKTKAEKDDLESRYNALKKEFEGKQTLSTFPPQADVQIKPAVRDTHIDVTGHPRASSPSFRMPSPTPSDVSYCSDCPECQPLNKRKREASDDAPLKRSRSSSQNALSSSRSAKDAIADYLGGTLTVAA